MNYKHEHQLMNLDIREDKPKTLGFFMSPQLKEIINDKFESLGKAQIPTVYFTPYLPPNQGISQQVKEQKSRPRNEHVLTSEELKYKLIIKNTDDEDVFFGSEDIILPFLKHYRKQRKIIIVDSSTDFIVLEYESGEVTFPDDFNELDTFFESIPPKVRKEDIFLFDVYCNESEEQPIFVSVLAKNKAEAETKLADKNVKEFGEEMPAIYSGKMFYHPAYYK